MAIAIGAGIVGVASLASGAMTASAAGKAAGAQAGAAQNQIQLEQQEFNQEQQNEAPWMAAGNSALQQLLAGFSPGGNFTQGFNATNFQQTPQYAGYEFQQTQGNSAINANAAAKGMSLSPATAQALSKYNQGLAATDYQGWYNSAESQFYQQQQQQIAGLGGIASMGQNAVAGVNQAGQTATAGEVSATGAIGNAQAAGIMGQNNAMVAGIQGAAGAVSGGLNNSYYASLFNTPPPSTQPQTPATAWSPGGGANAPVYNNPGMTGAPINAGTFNTSGAAGTID